jgi:hypothetical protein
MVVMAVDGGLLVGYLTAYIMRGTRKVADRAFEALLERLATTVEERLGRRPIEALEQAPGDEWTEAQVGSALEQVTRRDPEFAAKLEQLLSDLDQRGGRTIINQVHARTNVQAIGGGIAVGRDYIHAPDPGDLTDAPEWVKVSMVTGTLVALAGMGIFFFTMFAEVMGGPGPGDAGFGETPIGIPIAFGLFFTGFVILAIGALGRSMNKRR